MKNLVIMLTFRWDDGDETGEYVLTVSDSVTAL